MINKIAIIRKLPNGKYKLVSKKKDKNGKRRNLGEFDSLEGAKKRERQIQYFKHQHNEDHLTEDKDTKILRELSSLAIKLEEMQDHDNAQIVYNCINDLCEDCDYLIDSQSAPDRQMNTDNSGYIGGMGTGGSYGLYNVPESTMASKEIKLLKIANDKKQKFIKLTDLNGKKIIEVGFIHGNKEVYKNFNNVDKAIEFFKDLTDEMCNIDMIANSNGLMGNTQLDSYIGGGSAGLSDAYFYRNIGNTDGIYAPINK